MTFPEYPMAGGVPQRLTREEIIEALRDNYAGACAHMRSEIPDFVGWPDMVKLLDWIEEHWLPPKNL